MPFAYYGPRAAQVATRLDQLRCLTPAQYHAMVATWNRVWDSSNTLSFEEAFARSARAAQARDVGKLARDLALDVLGTVLGVDATQVHAAGWEVVSVVIQAEIVGEALTSEQYQLLVFPLDLVADLPTWWAEPASRSLFFEMLGEGALPLDAQAVVAALL